MSTIVRAKNYCNCCSCCPYLCFSQRPVVSDHWSVVVENGSNQTAGQRGAITRLASDALIKIQMQMVVVVVVVDDQKPSTDQFRPAATLYAHESMLAASHKNLSSRVVKSSGDEKEDEEEAKGHVSLLCARQQSNDPLDRVACLFARLPACKSESIYSISSTRSSGGKLDPLLSSAYSLATTTTHQQLANSYCLYCCCCCCCCHSGVI